MSVAHGRCESCHAHNTPGWRVCRDCGHNRTEPPMTDHTDPRRSAHIIAMAHAGQQLALQWGHPAWSDSWAETVAQRMLEAHEAVERALEGAR